MPLKIMITGAGGPAAYSLVPVLDAPGRELHAADIDPNAAGLYLVPGSCRHLVPRGDSREYVDAMIALCGDLDIDVLVPTVDCELLPLAESMERFVAIGVRLLVAPASVLRLCLDKAVLATALDGIVPVPATRILDAQTDLASLTYPCILKPRTGSGSRGIVLATSPRDLVNAPLDGSQLIQEYLPGAEYSVDVLADAQGQFVAAVPRERLKVDSGVAVAARTVIDNQLVSFARAATGALRLPYVSNVQFRRDAEGVPHLLEINPRFPGTMPLTVASGIDMPNLALGSLLGDRMPSGPMRFREIGMVRMFSETFLSVAELCDIDTHHHEALMVAAPSA